MNYSQWMRCDHVPPRYGPVATAVSNASSCCCMARLIGWWRDRDGADRDLFPGCDRSGSHSHGQWRRLGVDTSSVNYSYTGDGDAPDLQLTAAGTIGERYVCCRDGMLYTRTYRGPCSSGDHVHVDKKVGGGRIQTRHYYW